jgi:anti-sigma regulatory factor (Ser/Thr protein kinase)
VTEAAANAVVHAYGESDGKLCVRADVDDGELVVVIADTGRGVASGDGRPGAGLGLPLIASLTSRFRVRTGGGGTEVHMTFPCPQAG